MGFNADLADRLDRIAAMLELTGANRFRVNAHARAARAVRDQTRDLRAIAHDEDGLTKIEGIGKGIASKVAEFADTGTIAEHDELAGAVPGGLLPLLGLQGVGPKTLKALWDELGVESADDLKKALDSEAILKLKGMGPKSVENLRDALARLATAGQRLHIGVAEPIAEAFVERMRAVPGVTRAAYAGSLRRGQETIGDIDVLVAADDPAAAGEAFRSAPGVERVLAAGETKSSVEVDLAPFGVKRRKWIAEDGQRVQVDLRVVPADRWGAALLYFTGSKDHNVRLRERAIARGMTLNEWGLFEDDGGEGPPQQRGLEPVAASSEEDVYKALGLPWIPPTLREDRGELSAEPLPKVIELADIKAELHSHTTASDGKMSIAESAAIARARGFHTLAITDHSKSSAVANGLKEDRLRAHIDEVRRVNDETEGITILPGSEVDILVSGDLDYDDGLLAALDVVVASPHVGLKAKPAQATKRLLRAIEHPLVHIIGHPTGRLILSRPGMEPAIDELVAAAKEHNVALEINANWQRLDLKDTHVRAAVEAGCLIAIDCDDHHAIDYDNLRFGVLTGQRGWLPAERCVNAWSAEKLHAWLRSKR